MEQSCYVETANWLEACNMAPKIDDLLNKFADSISIKYRVMMNFNLACAELFTRKPSSALKRVNKILNYNDLDLRQDSYAYTLLLELAILIDLEDYSLAEYKLRNTKRYFRQRRISDGFFRLLFRFFSQYLATHRPADKRQAVDSFCSELDNMAATPTVQNHLKIFHYGKWARLLSPK